MSEGHWLVTLLKLKFRTTNQFTIVVMEVNEVASSYGGGGGSVSDMAV